jgi:hypothetical protein
MIKLQDLDCYFLQALFGRSFQWRARLPQAARLDGLAYQSRSHDASPYGHGGLLDAHFHRVPAEIDDMVSVNKLPLT